MELVNLAAEGARREPRINRPNSHDTSCARLWQCSPSRVAAHVHVRRSSVHPYESVWPVGTIALPSPCDAEFAIHPYESVWPVGTDLHPYEPVWPVGTGLVASKECGDRAPQRPAREAIGIQTTDVAALLGKLKIASADVYGYSMGGAVATQLAISQPQLVRRLVIAGTARTKEGSARHAVPRRELSLVSARPSTRDR